MIIDVHSHVLIEPKIYYSPGLMMMSVEDQLGVMDQQGIDKAIILPMVCSEDGASKQSIAEVLTICNKHPDRFIPFCNYDPRRFTKPQALEPGYFEYILSQFKDLGCRGLGEMTCRLWWDDPRVLDLFGACEKLGFPVTFHTTVPESVDYGLVDEIGFPRLEKALQKFPNLKFFGHSQGFWAEISSEVKTQDKWGYPEGPVKSEGSIVRLMRKYPNLHGDISANSGFNALSRDPEFGYNFIETFQDQILFGLDYCSTKNDRPHLQWLTKARDENKISNQAYEKIMWENINRILDLGLEK